MVCQHCKNETDNPNKKFPKLCDVCGKRYINYSNLKCYKKRGFISDKRLLKLQEIEQEYLFMMHNGGDVPRAFREKGYS